MTYERTQSIDGGMWERDSDGHAWLHILGPTCGDACNRLLHVPMDTDKGTPHFVVGREESPDAYEDAIENVGEAWRSLKRAVKAAILERLGR